MFYETLPMQFKAYAEKTKSDLPPLLAHNDSFKSISALEVKNIDYQGKPTEVGIVTTDRGVYGTFSGVVIRTLKAYFEQNSEPLTDVKVVQPRGKQYLTLESAV
jgi:hypothetical protein